MGGAGGRVRSREGSFPQAVGYGVASRVPV